MDKIIIKNMKFYAFHGVYPEERSNGQDFYIDAELYMDLKKAGKSDSLDDTADYSKIYALIKSINEINKFMLVEKLADTICHEVLRNFGNIDMIRVCVRKPHALMAGEADWVGVEVSRSRTDYQAYA